MLLTDKPPVRMADINEALPQLPVGLFQADRDGRVTAANAAFSALVQGTGSNSVGGPPWASAHPGDRASAELAWRRGVDSGDKTVSLEFRVWQGEGRMTWVRIDASPELDSFGRAISFAGTALDHTDIIIRRQLLDRMVTVVGASDEAVLVVDRNGAPVYTNQAARNLFGVVEEIDLVRDPTARGLLQAIRDQVPREVMAGTTSSSWTGEVGFRGSDGMERTLDIEVLLQRSPDGTVEYWGGVARDVTSTKHLQSELIRQANHDPLTGLPNRLLLLRTAAEALDRIRETRDNVAILFMDVDRLKDVNDTVGHEIGDALLAQVAHRIAQATRPSDVVARIGGDEFVVLCDGNIDEHTAVDLAERIRFGLSGRIMVHGVEVELSVSTGVAITTPQHMQGVSSHDAANELLRNADIAMYQAKRRGRSRSELYTDAMRAESRHQKELSADLERALAAGQLRLAYQPIISTHSGRVAGAQAVLRWDHPERGTMLPAQFMHVAEESGIIVPIGEWMITQACADTRSWLDSGHVDRGFSMHIAVAGRQLAEGTFVERVLATVRLLEMNPHQLTLDFAEQTLNDGQPGTIRSLQALRRVGVQLALDGFGTGVSSLTALRTCEADVLKLDGAIARTLGSNGDDDPIVRAIVQLAHALDMQVLAEWVTSEDQLRRLRVLGCDLVQGKLIGEPTAANIFGNLP